MQAKNQWRQRPKTCKRGAKVLKFVPPPKKPGCKMHARPPPPYPSNRPPRPTPIATPSQAPLLGLGLARSLVVRGLPLSGVSTGRSRAKKKSTTRGAERSFGGLRAAIPPASGDRLRFWGRRWGNSSGSAAWRARTRKGSAVVLLLWGAEPWGCLERPELGLLSPKEPPRECRALSAGVRCGKKGEGICAGQDLERVPGLHVRVDKEVHV